MPQGLITSLCKRSTKNLYSFLFFLYVVNINKHSLKLYRSQHHFFRSRVKYIHFAHLVLCSDTKCKQFQTINNPNYIQLYRYKDTTPFTVQKKERKEQQNKIKYTKDELKLPSSFLSLNVCCFVNILHFPSVYVCDIVKFVLVFQVSESTITTLDFLIQRKT